MNEKFVSFNLKKKIESLPVGWISAKLNIISEKIVDGTHFTPQYTSSGIPFISVKDIRDNKISFDDCKYISEETHNELKKRCNPENDDILITKSGTIGRIAVVKTNKKFSLFVSVALIKPYKKFIDSQFLAYELNNYINHIDIQQSIKGGVIKNFHLEDLKEVKIFLAPYNEQKRIVSKLEELFTKLDAGIEYLKKTRILLKQYRQSIFKHVFEGKLTEKWRKENKNNSIFLEKIFMHQNYELEIEQIKKDSEIYGINEFPKEWAWVRIKNIAEKIQYGTSEKAIGYSNGIPVLRMGNIFDGKIIYDNLKYYPSNWSHLNEFLLEDGDVLFNRTNSAELVGKTAIYQSSYLKSVFASYLIRIKILKNYYNPMILSYFINSIYGRKFIKSVVSQQVGQANVNGTKLSLMPIPLISLLEQSQIIDEIEKRISKIENTSKILKSNINYGMRLKSNILRYAFEGKLIPQDPNDEPAEILLEKIKREQELNSPVRKEKSKIIKKKSNDIDNKQMRLM